MAKRGAEDQLTKDDVDSDRSEEVDPRVRTEPLAPIEGRQIRGMPKRKGLTPASFAAPAVPASSAPAATPFSFGASSSLNPSAPSFSLGVGDNNPVNKPAFSFGTSAVNSTGQASTQSSAPAPSPFSGFSFSKPTSSAAASFTSTPPTNAITNTPVNSSNPPANSPFSGFSFGNKPVPAAVTPTTDLKKPDAQNVTGGFSFASSAANGASSGSQTNPFAFGSEQPQSTPANAQKEGTEAEGNPNVQGQQRIEKKDDATPIPTQTSPPSEKDVIYYTELRGLNTSFLNFLSTTLEADQFADLSAILPGLLEQYGIRLVEVARKAGRPVETKVNGDATKANGSIAPPAPPAPPAVASFTLLKPVKSTTAPSTSGGFVPSLPATTSNAASPFSFGNSAFKSSSSSSSLLSTEKAKPSAEVSKLVEELADAKEETVDSKPAETPKPFTFGGAPPKTTFAESPKPHSPLFAISPSGPLHPTTPASKTFVPSSQTVAATPPPPSKLGKFGPGGATPQLSFGGAKPSTPGSASGTPAATGSSFSFSFGGSASNQAKPASTPFTFGASSSTPTAAASTASTFSFGAVPSGTTPASFSFGSTSNAPAKPASSPFGGFSGFGNPTGSNATPAAEDSNPASENASGEATPDEAPGTPSRNLAEMGGAGEEGEDTVHEVRAVLYRYEDGQNKKLGVGPFKIKRSREGGKRRLLMRMDVYGTLMLNMNLSASLKATAEGKTVKFVGFTLDGKPAPYTLQVKTPELSKELAGALEKEIETIKGES